MDHSTCGEEGFNKIRGDSQNFTSTVNPSCLLVSFFLAPKNRVEHTYSDLYWPPRARNGWKTLVKLHSSQPYFDQAQQSPHFLAAIVVVLERH